MEQDRASEQEKWRAYYDAQATAQHAKLNVLRMTGTLEKRPLNKLTKASNH